MPTAHVCTVIILVLVNALTLCIETITLNSPSPPPPPSIPPPPPSLPPPHSLHRHKTGFTALSSGPLTPRSPTLTSTPSKAAAERSETSSPAVKKTKFKFDTSGSMSGESGDGESVTRWTHYTVPSLLGEVRTPAGKLQLHRLHNYMQHHSTCKHA